MMNKNNWVARIFCKSVSDSESSNFRYHIELDFTIILSLSASVHFPFTASLVLKCLLFSIFVKVPFVWMCLFFLFFHRSLLCYACTRSLGDVCVCVSWVREMNIVPNLFFPIHQLNSNCGLKSNTLHSEVFHSSPSKFRGDLFWSCSLTVVIWIIDALVSALLSQWVMACFPMSFPFPVIPPFPPPFLLPFLSHL